LDEREVEFLRTKINSPLLSDKNDEKGNYTRDGGKTFYEEENQNLMATYYFLGGDLDEYFYDTFNFINLASELGGLIEVIYIIFSLFPFFYYNPKVTQRKFIEKLFFVEKDF
jgi:hypothetical protein